MRHAVKRSNFVAGAEAGTNKGKAMVVTRALYGLKTSAKAWQSFFGVSLNQMGYKSCPAYPDVYMRRMHQRWTSVLVLHVGVCQ